MGCGSSKEGSAAIVPLDDRDKDVQVDVGEAGEVSVETNNTSEKINDHAKGKSPLESKVSNLRVCFCFCLIALLSFSGVVAGFGYGCVR